MATIVGDSGLVGGFGTQFGHANVTLFGYVAYAYLLFLLYPLYRFYKDPKLTFRRLELIVSCSLFFVALLISQALIFNKGSFGMSLVLFLKDYIGFFGVWVLNLFFILFSWLIATERNLDLLLKQTKHRCLVIADLIKHISIVIFVITKRILRIVWKKCKNVAGILRTQVSNASGVLDFQNSKQEEIKQVKYDFADVNIEEAFDELTLTKAKSTDLNTTNTTHSTIAPAEATQHPNAPQNTSDSSALTPEESPKIPLQIVEASQENLEDFFKNQIARHKDILQNLKLAQYTALSSPLNSQKLEVTPITLDSQQTPKASPTPPKEIPTPPPRPINPSVFLQTKPTPIPTKEEKQTVREETQDVQTQTTENQTSTTTEVTRQETRAEQEIREENLKATTSNNYIVQNSHNIIPQNNAQEDEEKSTPSLDSVSHPAQPQTPPQTTETAHSSFAAQTDSMPHTKPHEYQSHAQPAQNIPQSQNLESPSRSLAPTSQPVIQHNTQPLGTTQGNPTQSTSWVDSIIQEVVPSTPTKNFSDPTESYLPQIPKRHLVTELDENTALLSGLEYGKVLKPLNFKLPTTSLLNPPNQEKTEVDESEIDRKIEDLLAKLKMFRVEGDIARTYSGPIVTTFEFRPAPNVKVSKILTLEDDLAMALRARSIRIQAPIPGKDVVGIEIPNNSTQTIYLREILESDIFKNSTSPLTLALGKDIVGNPFITDLKKLPHLLIAGTTGSGKSVGINAMILSLLYKNSPENLKLLMIDPKKVEFSIYSDIPHLITPIITQPKKAIVSLNSAVAEMDRRYDLMSEMRTKDIDTYNRKVQSEGGDKFPYLVIIIDELADLMMTGGKEVEFALARIAQMGRASGIHIIVATQRPSVDVVTGLIKTNLPSRISYKVGSKIDSKVILDTFGAESLLGRGDMLFTPPGVGGVIRLHAPWNTEEEIEKVASFIKSQQEVAYDKNFMLDEREQLSKENNEYLSSDGGDLIREAKNIILQDKKTSASYLQRRLSIGYNKAANIVEQLEKEGFLSAPNIKGIREILGS